MKVKLVAAAEVEDVGVVADERTDDAVQAAEVGEQRLCSHTGVIVVEFRVRNTRLCQRYGYARTQSSSWQSVGVFVIPKYCTYRYVQL